MDLEYPDHLHDLHNDYPLAPESVNINKVEKPTPKLHDKLHYSLSGSQTIPISRVGIYKKFTEVLPLKNRSG